MELHVLNHPLVEHKLTVLRDKNTPSSTFRELVSELVMLEAYEATRNLSVVAAPIETPVAPMTGKTSWEDEGDAEPTRRMPPSTPSTQLSRWRDGPGESSWCRGRRMSSSPPMGWPRRSPEAIRSWPG